MDCEPPAAPTSPPAAPSEPEPGPKARRKKRRGGCGGKPVRQPPKPTHADCQPPRERSPDQRIAEVDTRDMQRLARLPSVTERLSELWSPNYDASVERPETPAASPSSGRGSPWSWVVRWVDGVELAREKGRLRSILAAGSSQRPEWARCTPGGLMGVIAPPPRLLGCSWRVGSSAVPLVRVCAAGMGSVRSWRTWRAAQASYLRLDMLKTGRFLVWLGKIRFSQCVGCSSDI